AEREETRVDQRVGRSVLVRALVRRLCRSRTATDRPGAHGSGHDLAPLDRLAARRRTAQLLGSSSSSSHSSVDALLCAPNRRSIFSPRASTNCRKCLALAT